MDNRDWCCHCLPPCTIIHLYDVTSGELLPLTLAISPDEHNGTEAVFFTGWSTARMGCLPTKCVGRGKDGGVFAFMGLSPKSALDDIERRLQPVTDLQFGEDVRQMGFD